MANVLPLTALLGPHAHRLRGIEGWSDLPLLGAPNLAHLLDFARKAALDEQDTMDRAERAERRDSLAELDALARATEGWKPVLPRLRVECFRVGQAVRLLLADTPGAHEGWASATIREVSKRHKPEWAHHFPSRGYYWRLTAAGETPLLGASADLAFSTSEPRVMVLRELEFLKRARTEDPAFLHIYCDNARRIENPIWCEENGVAASGEALDLHRWLDAA